MALIRWAGKESVKLRKDVTSDDGSCTIPVFRDQTQRLVSQYKQVGMHNTPTGFLGEETAFNCAGAATATKAFMRPVLTQKSIPISLRLGLLRMPCLSHTSCGLISMGLAQLGQLGRLDAEHMRAVKRVLHASKCDTARIPDDELRTLNEIPSTAATSTCRRIGCASLLSQDPTISSPFYRILRDLSGRSYSSRTCG